ncbi:MAG: PAS sensor protein [Candidatus Cloacimonetes bacterium HGW-Cloacimonetes-1]|jgi:transcriptional regulator with PAS, ATPase and Fis domain|nr:MAG: PAS sensor protein [Candidatus Cloacimonetes bacterium HGW-Cloacimonetes-1]
MDWVKEIPFAVTVCDTDGIITSMNDKACETFSEFGGETLLGTSLYDCHSPRSSQMIKDMMASGSNNAYTIEKKGVKKMIIQQPWFKDGEVAGIVEISIVLPTEMSHYVRS